VTGRNTKPGARSSPGWLAGRSGRHTSAATFILHFDLRRMLTRRCKEDALDPLPVIDVRGPTRVAGSRRYQRLTRPRRDVGIVALCNHRDSKILAFAAPNQGRSDRRSRWGLKRSSRPPAARGRAIGRRGPAPSSRRNESRWIERRAGTPLSTAVLWVTARADVSSVDARSTAIQSSQLWILGRANAAPTPITMITTMSSRRV
jgi:hypothetical protein